MGKGKKKYISLPVSTAVPFAAPEITITITGMKAWVDDSGESFMDQSRRLKRVNIRDAGTLNILEIAYEKINGHQRKQHEICVPVPKGKLCRIGKPFRLCGLMR